MFNLFAHDKNGKADKSWLDLEYVLHNTWNHYQPLNMLKFILKKLTG